MNYKVLVISIAICSLFCSCKSEEKLSSSEKDVQSIDSVIITEVTSKTDDEKEITTDTDAESFTGTDVLSETNTKNSSESLTETPEPESSDPSANSGNNKYDTLILVNPSHFIPDDYVVDLETVQGKYKMDKAAASHAKELVSAAKSAGYDMQLCSAYRTIETSERLYNNKVSEFIALGYSKENAKTEAAKWVAPPGTSEHHTGLAMDLVSKDYWNYYSDLEHDYENFDSFKWMYNHCWEYGFILRYPKDKQDITGITYEPWHYRYVGIEAAKYIMENGLCLEEYVKG